MIDEEIERLEKENIDIPEIKKICNDWIDERRDVLPTVPFDRLDFVLPDIDRRFMLFLDYAKDFK